MSSKLEAVKAEFDAMIEKMKEEFCRQVDLEMEMLLEMWREEKRMKRKKPICARAVKRMRKDKAAEDGGGHQSDENEDNEDSVSVKSEIESDECHCDSDDEDYSNFEVKEEPSDEEGAMAPIASTSRGQKRQATPAPKMTTKKRRVDSEHQESASGSGNYKMKIISIDCTVKACQRTFRCGHTMREHLLVVHKVKPFQCRAQGCGQQFDMVGEFTRHSATHPRATSTWLCSDCPGKTFASGNAISQHITRYHQTGQYQCTIDQCQFTSTTRSKVRSHQDQAHLPSQHTCPFDGCTRSFKLKKDLARHQRTHTSTTPFRCTFVDCGYEAKHRDNMVKHIRIVHFHLPKTLKEQHHLGIVDHRDPNEFIQVNEEQLAPRQP